MDDTKRAEGAGMTRRAALFACFLKGEEGLRALDMALDEAYEQGRAEAQRWIPVSERLPEVGERIAFWDCVDKVIQLGLFELTSDQPIFLRMNTIRGSTVTHWQPLPPAPAAVTEKGEK